MKMRPFMHNLRQKTIVDPLQDFRRWQQNRPHIKRLTVEELSPSVPPRPFEPLPIPYWVQEAVRNHEESIAETVKREAVHSPLRQGSTWVYVDVAEQPTIEMPVMSLPITGRHPTLPLAPQTERERVTGPRRGAKITNPLPAVQNTAPLHPINLEKGTHSTGRMPAMPRSSHVTQPLSLDEIVESQRHEQIRMLIRYKLEQAYQQRLAWPTAIYISKANRDFLISIDKTYEDEYYGYFYQGHWFALRDDAELTINLDETDVACEYDPSVPQKHWLL